MFIVLKMLFVASEETISVLSQLTEYIQNTRHRANFIRLKSLLFAAALRAMRNDLMHYPIPTPESGQEENRIR